MSQREPYLQQCRAPCTFLAWDSDFWGVRVASITQHTLTEALLADVFVWCADQQIDLLYFLAATDSAATVCLAENNQFHLTDIRITFEHALGDIPGGLPAGVRPCIPSDIPSLRSIARTSHLDSRFYYDTRLTTEEADALYETWITNSCTGYADTVLVAELNGQPVGYVTCHIKDQEGSIGLVGVGEAARGKGVGRVLVDAALYWYVQRGVAQVTVVTQARNIAAQRLYQRAGFVTQSIRLWYHRWFEHYHVR